MTSEATSISESKAHIMAQARKLFAAHGYRGVSIRQVAEASGLAKASLYHHFKDKRDLYFQVLEMDAAELVVALEQASQVGVTARERFFNITQAYVSTLTTGDSLIPLAFREFAVPGQDIYDFVERWRDPLLHPIRHVIEDGIAQGELREVEPDLATHCLFGLFNTFIAYIIDIIGV
jgi:AcrR family transcriptional regulator